MIIKRIVADPNGDVEATLALDKEQAQFLLNVGIATLMAQGVLKIQDMTKEQFEAEIAKSVVVEGLDESDDKKHDPITIN